MRPRGFRHTFIYYDERKAMLRKMEERARRELDAEERHEAPDGDRTARQFDFSCAARRSSRPSFPVIGVFCILLLLALLTVVLFLILNTL